MTRAASPRNPDRAPERDYLMRHRANCVADALWGLYNSYDGQQEPRRWQTLAPRAPVRSRGGGTKGAMMVDAGDGTMAQGQTAIPTQKPKPASFLTIRVPELEPFYIDAHHVYLMYSDYTRALEQMPGAWSREWRRFERCATRSSIFRFTKNSRMKSASLHPHHYTSDPLMCAGLFLVEVCTVFDECDDDEHSTDVY